MKKYGLNKSEKLCSPTAIDKLFSRGANSSSENEIRSAIVYPLRAVWTYNSARSTGSQIQFLISIPKKRLRHAVDRVLMRRRVREAYRLNKPFTTPEIADKTDIALIYIADSLKNYQTVEKAVCRILQKINNEKDTAKNSCNSD